MSVKKKTSRTRAKAKLKAIVAVVSHAGRARDGSDTEWLLAAEGDMVDVGVGDEAIVVAAEAVRLLAREIPKIPTGQSQHDQNIRKWMLEIAAHKAAIGLGTRCGRLPSVSMHYLIEKTNEWGATIFETTRQLLKHDMLPIRSETEL